MRCLSRRGLLPSERANLWRLPVAIRRLLFLRYDRPCFRQLPNVRLSFLINRSRSAEPSELASALAYSRFSPPIDVPPSLRFVSVPCASVFTAKLGRRTAEAAHLCTFPLVCAHFRTLVHISALPRVIHPQRNRIAVELDTPHAFPSSILFRKIPFIFQDTP